MNEKEKIDKFLFEENVRRLCLFDSLRRKPYLQGLTLKELDCLIDSVLTLITNLNNNFEKGTPMINVSDKDSWSGSSLFRNIFIYNVLEFPINYDGTDKKFKQKLIDRWTKNE